MTHNDNMILVLTWLFNFDIHWVAKKEDIGISEVFWVNVLVSCPSTSSTPVRGSEAWRLFVLHDPQSTHDPRHTATHLPVGHILNRERFDAKMVFIGNCSENEPLGFGEGVRRRSGGRGISESGFVAVHPLLIQQEGAWVTQCAKELDIPKDESFTPTSDKEIRALSYTSDSRRKQVVCKRRRERTAREKMDAVTYALPRLQLTVPMPMKTGKVISTFI